MLGYEREEFICSFINLKSLIHPDDIKKVEKKLRLHIKGKTPYFELEYRTRRKNGKYIWILNRAKVFLGSQNKAKRIIGFYTNIHKKTVIAQERERIIITDKLTGLLNRNGMGISFDNLKKNSIRFNRNMAVLFIDLDGFKNVNDTLGHAVGDEVLIKIGSILKQFSRVNEIAVRLGGDEFLLFIPEFKDKKELSGLATRLIAKVNKSFKFHRDDIHIGLSIGITIIPPEQSLNFALEKADKTMYMVKKSGKNNFKFSE